MFNYADLVKVHNKKAVAKYDSIDPSEYFGGVPFDLYYEDSYSHNETPLSELLHFVNCFRDRTDNGIPSTKDIAFGNAPLQDGVRFPLALFKVNSVDDENIDVNLIGYEYCDSDIMMDRSYAKTNDQQCMLPARNVVGEFIANIIRDQRFDKRDLIAFIPNNTISAGLNYNLFGDFMVIRISHDKLSNNDYISTDGINLSKILSDMFK